ncbi:class I SAM-dependent methyltransferase [Acinetobacter sp. MD2(2019)]|uniref:class I SAM-dependent methyltransferase n=1 Tax=Acinetobacter sp. MD2(2019) TaxID=2605273 RepID=UPI002D1EC9CA|nr:class I SAM-dependent methyltransferase [Acinetobacter sp. MD2(2019)]MEB3753675.1 class I SAM-dependent methyltransferase [Acinetobacter sp. MD2(2019)]
MDPRSEVILRQQDYLKGRVLLINAPADGLIAELPATVTDTTLWTWNFATHQAQQQQGLNSHFDTNLPAGEFDQVVVYIPKSKELLNYLLYQIASHLPQGTLVLLVGEKKGGIEGAAKQTLKYGKAMKLDSARHCQLWCYRLEAAMPIKPLESWLKSYSLKNQGLELEIFALPGVFSQERLDVGTAVLLPYLSQVKSGKLADFGCGAGIISCALAKAHPNNIVYALDVDAFALQSTKISSQRNGLAEQIQTLAVTGIYDAPTALDALISNPPFHQGIHTDYQVSENLCRSSKKHLAAAGELWIVANRFLNYPTLIEQHFGHCTVKADQQGFKVLHACAKQ